LPTDLAVFNVMLVEFDVHNNVANNLKVVVVILETLAQSL